MQNVQDEEKPQKGKVDPHYQWWREVGEGTNTVHWLCSGGDDSILERESGIVIP